MAAPPVASVSDADLRFQLPGLNLPLNWIPYEEPRHFREKLSKFVSSQGETGNLFPCALNQHDSGRGRSQGDLIPIRELTMLHIMNVLSDKPSWDEKVFDDTIAEKWKAEAIATEGRDVTQSMADWVIAELRYKAQISKTTSMISVYQEVVKSDTIISPSIKDVLQRSVAALEEVPEIYKDYHPGSDGRVLDLVHPSLFPLIYGRSRVVSDSLIGLDDCVESCGKGQVIPIRSDDETILRITPTLSFQTRRAPYSKTFQWLPSEVKFSKDDSVKFTSYINNLHQPRYKALYSAIEQIIEKAIPLWNQTLTPLGGHIRYGPKYDWRRIIYTIQKFDPDPDIIPVDDRPKQREDESEDEYEERLSDWEKTIRRVVLPEPGEFKPPTSIDPKDAIDLRRDYRDRGLQVIVKLANIELTPEKSTYEGGVWHVEGQMNEHICATALYYYSNSNISPSHLSFRQQSSTDYGIEYEQDQHDFMEAVFGCDPQGPAVQELGSVACTEGRLLTFPNTLQHRVAPFSLADPSKSGHRKLLALFLVDPNIRIISTANVPPQQRDLWADAILHRTEKQRDNEEFDKMSPELIQQILKGVDDFPIGMDEAKMIRLSLMEERKKYVADELAYFELPGFSLCEH